MTKNEHRRKGLENAYRFLAEAEKALAGHKENQEMISGVQEIKNSISTTLDKLMTISEVLLDKEYTGK